MIQHKCSNSFDYRMSVMIKAFYVAKGGLAFVAWGTLAVWVTPNYILKRLVIQFLLSGEVKQGTSGYG